MIYKLTDNIITCEYYGKGSLFSRLLSKSNCYECDLDCRIYLGENEFPLLNNQWAIQNLQSNKSRLKTLAVYILQQNQ